MKSDFLINEVDLRRYLCMALGEASSPEAQAVEQDWLRRGYPTTRELQLIMFEVYKFPRPITPENFLAILERIGSTE